MKIVEALLCLMVVAMLEVESHYFSPRAPRGYNSGYPNQGGGYNGGYNGGNYGNGISNGAYPMGNSPHKKLSGTVYGIKGQPGKKHTYETWGKMWENGEAKSVEVPEHMETRLHSMMDKFTSFLGSVGNMFKNPLGSLLGGSTEKPDTSSSDSWQSSEPSTMRPTTEIPTTTTTTEEPEPEYFPDYQSKVPSIWEHITNTAHSRKEIQEDAMNAILALADLADLRCVDNMNTDLPDSITLLCKDGAKERFQERNDLLRRREMDDGIEDLE